MSQHRSEKARDAEQLRKKLPSAAADEAETLKRRIEELEVVAEVNDPAVRWEFENGKSAFLIPLAERRQMIDLGFHLYSGSL